MIMAKRAPSKQKKQAYELYCNTEMTQREIAEFLGVAERTMSLWVNANKGEWRADRDMNSVTKLSIVKQYYKQLQALNEAIEGRDEGQRYPTPAEADLRLKIHKSISAFDKRYDLGTYKTVLDEFISWMHMHHPKEAGGIAMPSVEFLRQKMEQINGN